MCVKCWKLCLILRKSEKWSESHLSKCWKLQSAKLYQHFLKLKNKCLVCTQYAKFQRRLFLKIRTLDAWLKSTLLLKIKCFDTHIYMKTYCLQTMRRSIIFRKERCSREAGEEEELAIIKSLIMLDRNVALGAR